MRIRQVNQWVILGYGTLALLTLVSVLVGDRYLHASDRAERHREESLRLADQLLAGSKSLTGSVRGFAATGDTKYRADFLAEQNVIRSRDRAVERLRQLGVPNEEMDLIEEAKANSDQLIALESSAFAAGEAGDLGRAVGLVYGATYRAALSSIYGPIERFREMLQRRLAAEVAQARHYASVSRWVAQVLILMNITSVSSVLILFYRRRVVDPLTRLDEDVRHLLAGEASEVSHQQDDSEIGDLARSFAAFCELDRQLDRQHLAKRRTAEFALALQEAHDLGQLGQVYLSRLADWFEVRYGVVHVLDADEQSLRLVSGYGVDCGAAERRTPFGSGLAGQCALDRQPLRFESPPADYVRIVSGTGSAPPAMLLIRPLFLNERLLGVVELAAFRSFDDEDLESLADLERIVVLNIASLEHQRSQSLDASRLRASEENLRSILDGMSEGIFSLDVDGIARYINPAACRLLGYQAPEVIGQEAHRLLHYTHSDGRDYPWHECPMHLAATDGQPRWVDQDLMWCKGGAQLSVSYRALPIRDHAGGCNGSFIMFSPVGESTAGEQS